MNYYRSLLLPGLTTPEQTGNVIKVSLTQLYKENHFPGGFRHAEGEYDKIDTNSGDLTHFNGNETIVRGNQAAYELVYHGGLIKND